MIIAEWINITHRIGLFELFWTIFGLMGFGVSIFASWDALADYRLLKRTKRNGIRTLVARANIYRESGRVVVQGVFVFIGIMAMFQLPNPDQDTAARVIIGVVFILCEFLLATSALFDRVTRHKILVVAERMDKRNPRAVKQIEEEVARVSHPEAEMQKEGQTIQNRMAPDET